MVYKLLPIGCIMDRSLIFTTRVVNTTRKEEVTMSPRNMKEVLIERTIAVIADQGLDKTTTKAITAGTGINEAYIYRCFAGKDDLLSKAFEKLDRELVDVTMKNVSVMHTSDMDFDLRSRVFFEKIWRFLIGNREKCIAFVRYYYSPYFEKYSAESHKLSFAPLVEEFSDAFTKEADVWMILNHILNVMLDFAVKVHNGQMSKEDDYTEHVFRVIYRSIEQYFKKSDESEICK